MKYLVTGAAGFIGSTVTKKLLDAGDEVVGVDNLNDYYDVNLKKARLELLKPFPRFKFYQTNIAERDSLSDIFSNEKPERVLNLAAQAGVRYSVTNPHAYVEANLLGFLNILEGCRHHQVTHLVYASTSSVYGLSTKMPFTETDDADHPVSLYGATKRANELMAHSYGHMFGLPTTGLRFFTVYGPWGRPDMALFLFTKNILEGKPIEVFNHGHHRRDFTYIDDIAEGVCRVLKGAPAKPDSSWDSNHPVPSISSAPFRIYNIGNNRSIELMKYIEVLESELGKKALKKNLPLQQGDVESTEASVDSLAKDFGYRPTTTIETGIKRFVEWYRNYYKI
ncbi:MAG: wcaG [Bacteriovoracaceae bacterium]|nr:wcaG [Bacteriovoracaceae bacterium]